MDESLEVQVQATLNIRLWMATEESLSTHLTVSPNEAGDRLAIRELVEAYAHCADRRDAKRQMVRRAEHDLHPDE